MFRHSRTAIAALSVERKIEKGECNDAVYFKWLQLATCRS